jgi:hypothetical protein
MQNETQKQECKYCSHLVKGRSDKKFCNDHCRAAYHNDKNQSGNDFSKKITAILKRNRNILKGFHEGQSVRIGKSELDHRGFHWNYHTHFFINKKGPPVSFCFDYGTQVLPNNKIKIIHQIQS